MDRGQAENAYRVKWQDENGNWYYGRVDKYHEAHASLIRNGLIRVEDALHPEYDDIPVENLTGVKLEFGGEYDQYVDKAFEEARELSKSLPDGLHVGKLFSTPVADGKAWYVVTKVNKRTVRVEWRGFCPDDYMDRVLGSGGSFPKKVIEPLVSFTDGMRNLFGNNEDFVPHSGVGV